jgi:hypothetical protein
MDRRELLSIAALLLGSSVSSSCTRAILSAGDLPRGDPALFDRNRVLQVSQLSEVIIPQTDTAGAIQAGVPEFIHRVVAQWYTPRERAVFLTGLKLVDAESHAQFGGDFVSATHHQQRIAVLQAFEAKDRNSRERAFFEQLKELTVLGYYTSEIGSQQELVYRPVPGVYHGHALFGAADRQFAL